ncbi:N-acetylmannosamine kinase [Psychromonas ossibalaenae]|uniref:N-acetylmannosamine kinase n=1 Tax=Psychromonas ossibalaenae TaxID=444922 RepID=UPI000366EDF2|nr:N-acetylmannosamine kinase [Psychromonas ossibalaenae]
MNSCLAVDIGGTKMAAALICDGVISSRTQIKTPSSTQPEVMDEALTELITGLSKDADFIAVASTGIIQNGILGALNPDNLGGLNNYPLQNKIQEISQRPVYVINDAQAAGWAEYKLLPQDISNMAFITISTGVGAGIVINNKLLTGSRGVAGHAGHVLADPNGSRCGCGRRGCVESIASGTAIGNAGKVLWGDHCDGKYVYKKFLDQDPQAQKIIQRSAQTIANLVADLSITLDVEQVVLGGSIGLAPGYIELVRDCLDEFPAAHQSRLSTAACGADAGLIGAAQWALSLHK